MQKPELSNREIEGQNNNNQLCYKVPNSTTTMKNKFIFT